MKHPLPKDWREELAIVDQLMKDVSRQTDPQELVRIYGEGVDKLFARDAWISLSRRGLSRPDVRITRSSSWQEDINPWKEKHRLPIIKGGMLEDLIYRNEPRYVPDFTPDPKDPAYEYFKDARSFVTFPQYDNGEALNMFIPMWREPNGFDPTKMPALHWQSNLFGRGTLNMVLRQELRETYDAMDRELQVVGEIQRSLLPQTLPTVPGLDLAASYETSQRAGGDYYDLFCLPDGSWGLFIADVSGHGTPAAVMMAITHAIAHSLPGPPTPPGSVLDLLNRKLLGRYTYGTGTFVTAFYAVFHPATKRLTYACAGHNPPRLRRADGSIIPLDAVGGFPLGLFDEPSYADSSINLASGDLLLLYTDGIVEAMDNNRREFGVSRLDELLRTPDLTPDEAAKAVTQAVERFTQNAPISDDRTLLAAKVR